jgi:hypothetical protein
LKKKVNGSMPGALITPIDLHCSFAEEALEACELAHCFDLGTSAGINSKTGLLEE